MGEGFVDGVVAEPAGVVAGEDAAAELVASVAVGAAGVGFGGHGVQAMTESEDAPTATLAFTVKVMVVVVRLL